MNRPRKFYHICQAGEEGKIMQLDTRSYGEPNNWWETEKEAEDWITETFQDAHTDTMGKMVLIVLPVFLVTSKP